MGAAAARALAERGWAVSLLEQHAIGHDLGGSGHDTRSFRLSHSHADDVRLAVRALELWNDLERRSGVTLLRRNGLLQRGSVVPPMAAALREAGVGYDELDHRDVSRLFPEMRPQPDAPRPRAVLLDRDGTLVHDVPYNGDPGAVEPVPGAREAIDRLRATGLLVGVVTNQSGLARGLLTTEQVEAVNAEVEARLGPFGTWQVCPHGPDEGCACRKPRPGMVHSAARRLGVRPEDCVVIGDIGADAEAARAAGARSVLVPTPVTRAEEIAAAPVVATDLAGAVDIVLGWHRG